MTVGVVMTLDCVLRGRDYPNKLDSARKVSTYLAKHCGISKEDLPANLLTHFNKFAQEATEEEDVILRL